MDLFIYERIQDVQSSASSFVICILRSIADESRHALKVVGVDSKTDTLGGTRNVKGLDILCLARRIEGEDVDRSGICRHDIHVVVAADGCDIVVNGTRTVRLGVLLDNGSIEVTVYIDLRHH